jgi:hypothetical protein
MIVYRSVGIVERVTFGGNIIETGPDSFRLAHAGAAGRPAGMPAA